METILRAIRKVVDDVDHARGQAECGECDQGTPKSARLEQASREHDGEQHQRVLGPLGRAHRLDGKRRLAQNPGEAREPVRLHASRGGGGLEYPIAARTPAHSDPPRSPAQRPATRRSTGAWHVPVCRFTIACAAVSSDYGETDCAAERRQHAARHLH